MFVLLLDGAKALVQKILEKQRGQSLEEIQETQKQLEAPKLLVHLSSYLWLWGLPLRREEPRSGRQRLLEGRGREEKEWGTVLRATCIFVERPRDSAGEGEGV